MTIFWLKKQYSIGVKTEKAYKLRILYIVSNNYNNLNLGFSGKIVKI